MLINAPFEKREYRQKDSVNTDFQKYPNYQIPRFL